MLGALDSALDTLGVVAGAWMDVEGFGFSFFDAIKGPHPHATAISAAANDRIEVFRAGARCNTRRTRSIKRPSLAASERRSGAMRVRSSAASASAYPTGSPEIFTAMSSQQFSRS